jgi:hypothetical protein
VRIRSIFLALAPAAIVVAACSSSDELTLEPVTDEAGFTVTVEELGDEPRRQLRIMSEVGATQQVTQTQDIGIDLDAGGMSQSVQNPTTEIDITYDVTGVDGDRIEVKGTYDDVRVLETDGSDPTTVQATRDAMRTFAGATFLGTYTDRGSVVDIEFDGLDLDGALDGALGPMLDQLLASFSDSAESLSTPFPVEAIGVGGRWRVESAAELGGLPFEQTSIIEITGLDADRLVGTIDQELRFVEGEAEVFGLTVDVVGGEFSGGGTIEWDLGRSVLPYMDTTMIGTAIFEAQGNRVTQDQRQHIVVAPR